jgi:2-dehydropantoate 2-reductase
MNICVVGAGAVGGWVASRLALSGRRVMALSSRGAVDHLDIEEAGEVRRAAFTTFAEPADVAIIAVKAPSLASAAATALPHLRPETMILPMLNGVPWWFVDQMPLRSIDPDGSIARSLPFDQIVGCVVHASCSRAEDGRVIVKHADKLIIGEPSGNMTGRLADVHDVLDGAQLKPEQTNNIRRGIWYKLWGNATTNPLSALTRATTDRLHADPECRAWTLQGMAELARIGAAIGCPISESGEDRIKVALRLGAFKTSMLQDVEARRPIELEALLGAPREIARNLRIETPALDRLYGVTRLMAENLGLLPS